MYQTSIASTTPADADHILMHTHLLRAQRTACYWHGMEELVEQTMQLIQSYQLEM